MVNVAAAVTVTDTTRWSPVAHVVEHATTTPLEPAVSFTHSQVRTGVGHSVWGDVVGGKHFVTCGFHAGGVG